jgi:hypothetical protein
MMTESELADFIRECAEKQLAYEAKRRDHAAAIGRPIPDERPSALETRQAPGEIDNT